MARDIEGATRANLYAIDPELITLIWPAKSEQMGPHDLALDEHPELHYYFASDITDPLNEAHIASMMTPLPPPAKGRVGVIQPIAVAVLHPNDENFFEPMLSRPGSWHVACDGRTRTREAREANRRIRAAGGEDAELIRIRFEIKPVDGLGAILIRDIAQRCRKTESPLDLARKAENHMTQGTPRHVVLQAMGLRSWVQVEKYARLLTLDPKLQELVDARQIPIDEALRIGRESKSGEQKEVAAKIQTALQSKQSIQPGSSASTPVRLTRREVTAVRSNEGANGPEPMTKFQIRKWIERLENQYDPASLVALTVLKTVLGLGDMKAHPKLAPPSAMHGEQPVQKKPQDEHSTHDLRREDRLVTARPGTSSRRHGLNF